MKTENKKCFLNNYKKTFIYTGIEVQKNKYFRVVNQKKKSIS